VNVLRARARLALGIVTVAVPCCLAGMAYGQTTITIDNSWGRTAGALSPSGSATTVSGNRGNVYSVPGNVYTIPEAQGQLSGNNLFHSFQRFGVGAGDAAVFTTNTASLQNVISRVSGSSASQINGLLLLKSDHNAKPNFFFINPAGVTFGAGAQVDVPAAFHVSTADRLKFGDGTMLVAGAGADSTLSMAPPEAFGFLGNRQAAAVKFNNLSAGGAGGGTGGGAGGGAGSGRLKIALASGATFGISGGSVQLASVDIAVPAGTVRVAATGSAAVEVPTTRAVGIPLAGAIDAANSTLTTTGVGAIQLAGGQVTLRNGASLSGNAGRVNVVADSLSLDGAAKVSTPATAPDDIGSVTINVNRFSLLGGSQITSSSTGNQQTAGSDAITIQGLGGAGSSAQSVLLSGSDSSISTATDGVKPGGNIRIAAQRIRVEQLATITVGTTGQGSAGNIAMAGDSLAVVSGGRIEASTSAAGNGGSIVVTASGDVTVSGVSTDSQTRSGLFAKTQSPTTGGGGGGAGGGGTGGGSSGGGTGGGTGTSGGTSGGGTSGGTGGAGTGGGSSGGSGAGTTGGGGTGGGGSTAAATPGNAGNITIAAKNLLLTDGAQIDSSTTSGGIGGSVTISATESITVAGSSTRLTSDATRGNGKGGSIALVARNITVRDAASVTAATGGKGDAGSIALTAFDQLLLQSGGTVTTSTSGSGAGGTIVIEANQVMLDGPGTAIIADTLRPFADLTITINILHPNDGDLIVQLDTPSGTRVALLSRVGDTGDNFTDTKFNDEGTQPITSGSAPFTGTFLPREPLAQLIGEVVAGDWTLNVRDQAAGNTGTLQNWTLRIGQQMFKSSGVATAIPDNGILRSTVSVVNPALSTLQGIGEAPGVGGDVTVNAGTVTVRNGATMSAITRGSGKGGTVSLHVSGDVSISNNGKIAADTLGSGAAGNILVEARSLLANGSEVSSTSGLLGGNAGSISIDLRETLTLSDDAVIATNTLGSRAAGNISIDARSLVVSRSEVSSTSGLSSGNAGSISINLQDTLTLSDDAVIATDTFGSGAAGNISIDASRVVVSRSEVSSTSFLSSGNAGSVGIISREMLTLTNDARIATDTFGSGAAGNVSIEARSVLVNASEISSNSSGASSGNAGDVSVNSSGTLTLVNGGSISSSTSAPQGAAGSITANARQIVVDGGGSAILADALAGSSGQTGSVTVKAAERLSLSNGGILSIRNHADVPDPSRLSPTLLSVSAPRISLTDAQITAQSAGNVDASDIQIRFGDRMVVDPSSITTSANSGAGGDITIAGSGLLWLDHSQITTSAGTGNGGDINIGAVLLLLETGFIQANSGGVGTSGGNVRIAVQALISSGNTLSVADPTPAGFQPNAFGFNVIQAAAPTGVSGTIGLSAPLVDISGELSGLEAQMIETGPLGKDLCRVGTGSTLTPVGRGGLRPAATGLIRPDPAGAAPVAADPGFDLVRRVADAVGALDCRY
jgi:filamentous hemagglutinin family protein